jgi:hypothetical protein
MRVQKYLLPSFLACKNIVGLTVGVMMAAGCTMTTGADMEWTSAFTKGVLVPGVIEETLAFLFL